MSDRKATRRMQRARAGDEVASRKHLQVALELTAASRPLSRLTCTYMDPVNLSCSHKALFGSRQGTAHFPLPLVSRFHAPSSFYYFISSRPYEHT